ncbi:MAG TPA: sigma-70 family RNA polymerase sigma factor [Pyrinomonadaceae bacterium]|nr:sigma-70 family RNA polymerase sigma factor [Pyrinomonadaceae bacterium]
MKGPGNELRETALQSLHDFSAELDAHPEMIESLTLRELRKEMTAMGLDPDRPIPHLPACANATQLDDIFRRGLDNIVFDTAASALEESSADQSHESSRMRLLVARGADGTPIHVLIDALMNEPRVRRQLKEFCSRFDFRPFGGAYDVEDLYQDVWIKVWQYREKLARSGNVLSERQFAGWLFVVVRNYYCKQIRKLKVHRWSRSAQPIETIEQATDDNSYNRILLRQFLEFIKRYPKPNRRAIRLWLEDNTYREIAIILSNQGAFCSHVTIGSWIVNAIAEFRRTVEVYDTEESRFRAVKRESSTNCN